jgi:hypothetical protein
MDLNVKSLFFPNQKLYPQFGRRGWKAALPGHKHRLD